VKKVKGCEHFLKALYINYLDSEVKSPPSKFADTMLGGKVDKRE